MLEIDEIFLWSLFYWHQSCHSNEMASLCFLLSLVLLGSRGFFGNRSKELVLHIAASMLTKCKQNKWEINEEINEDFCKLHILAFIIVDTLQHAAFALDPTWMSLAALWQITKEGKWKAKLGHKSVIYNFLLAKPLACLSFLNQWHAWHHTALVSSFAIENWNYESVTLLEMIILFPLAT